MRTASDWNGAGWSADKTSFALVLEDNPLAQFVELPDELVVVPVIAVQRGASGKLLARLWQMQHALLDAGVGDPALEVYQVSLSGRLDRLHA